MVNITISKIIIVILLSSHLIETAYTQEHNPKKTCKLYDAFLEHYLNAGDLQCLDLIESDKPNRFGAFGGIRNKDAQPICHGTSFQHIIVFPENIKGGFPYKTHHEFPDFKPILRLNEKQQDALKTAKRSNKISKYRAYLKKTTTEPLSQDILESVKLAWENKAKSQPKISADDWWAKRKDKANASFEDVRKIAFSCKGVLEPHRKLYYLSEVQGDTSLNKRKQFIRTNSVSGKVFPFSTFIRSRIHPSIPIISADGKYAVLTISAIEGGDDLTINPVKHYLVEVKANKVIATAPPQVLY